MMNIKITPSNQGVLKTLIQVESVVKSLGDRGVTVLGVSTGNDKPRIKIARHAYCDQLIRSGKACYLQFGNSRHGYYKQGSFTQDGCRVFWSESIY
ncbi:TPA: hypothetical protein OT801_000575 [Morganella morganii]|nr:hypothetical protein [Morganella morganii]EKU4286134.1 hypothetical protein [Morganella morganii]EKU4304206.1 hypothetical protein [Morganella morganii]EKU6426842.1 hypothetical protein [Morganella morganii]ELA7729467.1 hypothetical protein [Morganella morganii]ELA7729947.1 hypothetical protein [Morganella morganii]